MHARFNSCYACRSDGHVVDYCGGPLAVSGQSGPPLPSPKAAAAELECREITPPLNETTA